MACVIRRRAHSGEVVYYTAKTGRFTEWTSHIRYARRFVSPGPPRGSFPTWSIAAISSNCKN